MLGAWPHPSWLKRLRRLGQEGWAPLWRHGQAKSPAPQSRWQWTWGCADSVFPQYGTQLGRVGTWWSGQHQRVLSGIDGLLRVVGIGDGRLVVPRDYALRRPAPVGSGAPCRDTRRWARLMRDERWAALGRRGLAWPAPMVVAARWLSDSKRRQACWPDASGDPPRGGATVLHLSLRQWTQGQRGRPHPGPGVAMTAGPVGGRGPLRAAAGDASHRGPGDQHHRG
jgi:hypothetical protein